MQKYLPVENKFLKYFFIVRSWIILHLILTLFYWLQISVFSADYNNFLVYRGSFYHLFQHKNLYTAYPSEYFDAYLYSHVFAFLMAPFAWLPVEAGLLVWLFFSVMVLLSALLKLRLKREHTIIILGLLIFDLGNNTQLAQANMIVLGGMIWCFYFLEKGQNLKFALLCALLFWIKVYPAALMLMIFFYNKNISTFAWFFVFIFLWGFLPLTIISPHELIAACSNWWGILSGSSILEHYSIMGFFSYQLKLNYPEWYFILAGTILLAVYYFFLLYKKRNLEYEQRISFFSFLLIWVVVFNRAAEPASYLLASAGIYIWMGFHYRRNIVLAIFLTAFSGITLLPSDLFPFFISNFFKGMVLKPVAGSVFLLLILFCYISSITPDKRKLNEY
jgi:Glycosyltransferase family 87